MTQAKSISKKHPQRRKWEDGYGNPYYGGYYYPYDSQTPCYGFGQPDYVTGHAEGSGSSFHKIEDFQPHHGYPRIYPEYQSPYDFNPSRSTPQSSYMQTMQEAQTTTFPNGSYSIKGKERQSQDFGQSPHSGIKSLKGKERQYQDFLESLDGDKSKEKQTPLQDYEEIETDKDKILNPEVPATSPRRSGLRYEELLKQQSSSSGLKTGPGVGPKLTTSYKEREEYLQEGR
ncbi:hypothetical protein PPACK8108_LOCUS23311 [Phakopsora pachyrhizi]|uniref:Uncharacterized protein n=1 Tax=Phakopsora pachyrhizi TaxID=170000 RepID=A0AAV0BM84_PHAPC|nr:hypothetical protein PPACK8108_LOCUS23311 [Phakopsora pachyrhizi]